MRNPHISSETDSALALRVYMLAHGLTQKELASRMGITEAGISRKLRGLRKWTLPDVQRIVKALDLSDEEAAAIFLHQK